MGYVERTDLGPTKLVEDMVEKGWSPWFDLEGRRWTYRPFGLGLPVTVTGAELVSTSRYIHPVRRRSHWVAAVIASALMIFLMFRA